MKKTTVLQFLFVLAVGAFLLAPSASATAGLRLFDGASCATSNCIEVLSDGTTATFGGGTLTTSDVSTPGTVTAIGKVGVWVVNVSTGETKPTLGSANAPEMDLSTTNNSSGAGMLTIQWSDTDFSLVPGYIKSTAGGTTNKGDSTSITYTTSTDAGNGLYTPGAPAATTLTWPPFDAGCTAGPCSWHGTASAGSVGPTNYSLMQQLVFVATDAVQISGDVHLQVVPEPASVLLLGGVLLVAVKAIRRSRLA